MIKKKSISLLWKNQVSQLNDAGSQSFPVSPWYTEKNAYISINKPLGSNKVKCGEIFITEIIVKAGDSSLFAEKLNFQLQSRSNFTIIGQYDLKTNKLQISNDDNHINFKISRKSSKSYKKIETKHKQSKHLKKV